MNTNKKFEEIMTDILKEENQAIMHEYEKVSAQMQGDIPAKIDENVLKAVIEYDKQQKGKRKKKYISVLSKVAIFIIVCAFAIPFIAPKPVDAFRIKILDMFFNEKSGSVSLRGQTEIDMIGDWNEYYYPEYMMDNYSLIGAEKMGERSIMLFVSNDRKHELRIEELPPNSNISIDTDHTSIENVKIGYYEAVYAICKEADSVLLTWVNEKKIISIHGDASIDKREYINIAENLKYVER